MIAEATAVWNYEAQPKERVDNCNLCGRSNETFTPMSQDRYGFDVVVTVCHSCELVSLPYRMTREAYSEFYKTAYRPLVSAFHGREINADTMIPEQSHYARELARLMRPWIDRTAAGTLLDIGGSTGLVSSMFRSLYCMHATVLDPSPEERAAAASVGHEIIPGLIEDFDPAGRTWDFVTLCQTADHLLDLMGSLKKMKGLLSPNGLFWSDIVDFDVTKEVKIDHPFNLTERTYRQFLSKAGFSLLQINYAPDGKHIGFLCK